MKKIIITFLVLILLLIAATPTILSVWGNQAILKQMEGNLTAEKFTFSWFSGQKVVGVEFHDKNLSLTAKEVSLDVPFYTLFFNDFFQNLSFRGLNLNYETVKLHNVDGTLKLTPSGTTVFMTGNVEESGVKEPFLVDVDWKGFDLMSQRLKSHAEMATKIENFPIEIIDFLATKQDPALSGVARELLGDRVNLQIDEKGDANNIRFQLTAKSPHMDANIKGSIENGVLSLSEKGGVHLTEKGITVDLDALTIPLSNPEKAMVTASIKELPTQIIDKLFPQAQATDILGSHVTFTIEAHPEKQTVNLHFTSPNTGFVDLQATLGDRIEVQGSVAKGGLFSGFFEQKGASYIFELNGQDVSSSLFPKQVQGSFGSFISFQVQGSRTQNSGPIKVNVQGENGNLSLDGRIERGVLKLNAPFVLNVMGKPEFGSEVLAEISPLLKSLSSSEQPITITLEPGHFYLPLFPFDVSHIQLGKGTIDLGKLTFDNTGELNQALAFLKVVRSDTINAWFTPLYFSINQGKIKVERFDFLVMDRYPMASWGTIDLPKDKIDMIVAISGSAINDALQLNLSDTRFMMQLPLKGPLNNAKLDTKKAAGKLAAATIKANGSAGGLVLGTLMDVANGLFTKSDKAPPPTTQPLPWRDDSGHSQPKKQNPVKEVEQTASKMLKKIFK